MSDILKGPIFQSEESSQIVEQGKFSIAWLENLAVHIGTPAGHLLVPAMCLDDMIGVLERLANRCRQEGIATRIANTPGERGGS